MSITADIHVIDKADISQHRVVSLTTTLPQLGEGRIRARSAIISLSNNNLSYAQGGTVRNWWETYPVPHDLSAPYDDQTTYGIVPAWGYGEVLESKVPGLAPGMLLWGFWPTTSLPVDLQLQPDSAATRQWVEVSSARKNLMSIYQRYFLWDTDRRLDSASEDQIRDMAWEAAARTTSEAGWIISKAVFGSPPVHPLGVFKWTEEDADLSSAVVVSLSASGKTARGFHSETVTGRAKGTGPLGLLAVMSKVLQSLVPPASFPTKVVSYGDMTSNGTLEWIRSLNPKKLAIVDFGARGNAATDLVSSLQVNFPNAKVVVIGVGGNSDLRTVEELGHHARRPIPYERVQMNMSGIKDRLLENAGPEAYTKEATTAWEALRKSSVLEDLKLVVGKGVGGEDGLEGGWRKLCKGEVPGDVAMAYNV